MLIVATTSVVWGEKEVLCINFQTKSTSLLPHWQGVQYLSCSLNCSGTLGASGSTHLRKRRPENCIRYKRALLQPLVFCSWHSFLMKTDPLRLHVTFPPGVLLPLLLQIQRSQWFLKREEPAPLEAERAATPRTFRFTTHQVAASGGPSASRHTSAQTASPTGQCRPQQGS